MKRKNAISIATEKFDLKQFQEQIHSLYPHFSKQQRIIANLLLNDPRVFAMETAKGIAKRIGVSSSTIVRFAFQLGFEGYPQFSKEIQRILFEKDYPLKKLKDSFDTSLDPHRLFESVMHLDLENIQRIHISQEEIDRITRMISSARKMMLIAGRASFSLIYYFGFLLRQIDSKFIFFNSGSDYGYEQVSSLQKDDLLFAISFNPYYRRTYDLVELASSRGIPIACITDYKTSPLVKHADFALMIPNEAPFCSYTAAMTLINTLIVGFANNVGNALKEPFEKNLEMLLKKEVYYFY